MIFSTLSVAGWGDNRRSDVALAMRHRLTIKLLYVTWQCGLTVNSHWSSTSPKSLARSSTSCDISDKSTLREEPGPLYLLPLFWQWEDHDDDDDDDYDRVTTGPGKSCNLGRPFSRPGKSWKTAKVMEKSWKICIMSWILWNFYNCAEKFCNVILCTVILTVLVQAAGTVTTNSGMHW